LGPVFLSPCRNIIFCRDQSNVETFTGQLYNEWTRDSLLMMNKIVWHHSSVTRRRREQQNGHKSFILWFTGLSGAGKSTLAHRVEERLHEYGCSTYVFDGDNVRHGLCSDLGFSPEDRSENIRRIGEMSKLFIDAGIIALTAFISPFQRDRQLVRSLVDQGDFIEIYCNAPIEICETRDVKGLYRRARSGEIPDFTGVSSPYEAPEKPELTICTGTDDLETCASKVISYLQEVNKIRTVQTSTTA
jgi:adenylylsulfate kinase